MATAKYLTDPPPQHRSHQLEKKKRKLEENTNKASVRLNGRLHHARSNDDRLPGRQKRDTAQIQHVDPICLPCSGEEVVIRHLLSDPLTSQMD